MVALVYRNGRSELLLNRPLQLTAATPKLSATVTMLIPKADRKAIHELVFLYNGHFHGNIAIWVFHAEHSCWI